MLKCYRNLSVKVYSSGAGFYIGTFHPEEGPMCRISCYYRTSEAAEKALEARDFDRIADENEFCNEGNGCQIKKVRN